MPDFNLARLEIPDSPSRTGERVRSLASGELCVVVGPAGSGKTWEVRKALPDAIYVRLQESPFLWQGFASDVARQVAHKVPLKWRFLARQDGGLVPQALHQALRGSALVIDAGERLLSSSPPSAESSWTAPELALQAEERLAFRHSLGELMRRAGVRCVIVSRAHLDGVRGEVIEHRAPEHPRFMLDQTSSPVPESLSAPGTLALLRAWRALRGSDAFDALLHEAEERGDVTPQRIGVELRQALGTGTTHILTLVDLLGDVERSLLRRALPDPQDDVEPIQMLIDLGLLELRGDRVEAPSFLRAAQVLVTPSEVPRTWMERLAALSLDQITEPKGFDLRDAAHVFRAHRLYVALHDIQRAMATTRGYAGGLVGLAAEISRSGDHRTAFDCYDRVLAMWRESLPSDWLWYDQALTPHLHSYVLHYRAYNGARARVLSAAEVEGGYIEARELWLENALWHGRLIGLHFELGQVDKAWAVLQSAEGCVRDHERRDWALRLLPARSAMRAGAIMEVLALIAPVLRDAPGDYRTARALQELLDALQRGVEVDVLKGGDARLVFHRAQTVEMMRLSQGWLASLPAASTSKQAPQASEALVKLVGGLADEARKLVQTPSHALTDVEISRKGRLIGLLDLLNSDIGLSFARDRWLVGRVDLEQQRFTELHRAQDDDVLSAPIASDLLGNLRPGDQEALWFARVETVRDGSPRSEVLELEPIGLGRSAWELNKELRRLSRASGDDEVVEDEP